MLGVKIFCGLILLISYVVMLTIMIILERDKPRHMIIWCIVFLFVPILGGVVYALFRLVYYYKRKTLFVKQREDEVYINLIKDKLYNVDEEAGEFYTFNKMAFKANFTSNNNYEIFDDYSKCKEALKKDISNASKYIMMELVSVNVKDFESIKDLLIKKVEDGVPVKLVFDKFVSPKFIKHLRVGGVKVYRFSKHNTLGNEYSNLRNCISIDGKICYIGNFSFKNRELDGKHDLLSSHIRFKGDIVQDVDVAVHQDLIFACGKFIDYNAPKRENYSGKCNLQYVSNEINNNFELLLIKAICMAKSSIQLQFSEFIPTESIMSLLRFAINSNISVKLMVPLKTTNYDKFYASRAYAKELALMGAEVYLYDGFIRFNALTIDNDYVIFGSFIMDRQHIQNSLQNATVINDNKAVNYFNRLFERGIENSYKIADAKYMLIRERFFKNFV